MSVDFTQAVRLKLRFNAPKGLLSAEDLWDLPLTSSVGHANLNDIAVALHKQLKSSEEVSFVETKKSDTTTQLKFDIVKHIIDVRLAENLAASTARANKEKIEQIQALIYKKQNDQLESTSLEDLSKMLESLKTSN